MQVIKQTLNHQATTARLRILKDYLGISLIEHKMQLTVSPLQAINGLIPSSSQKGIYLEPFKIKYPDLIIQSHTIKNI